MAWFSREKSAIEPPKEKRVQTEGLWIKCDGCKRTLWKKDLEANLQCCPKCNHHFRMSAPERLQMLFDDGRYVEHDQGLRSPDPLGFKDTKGYRDRLQRAFTSTGLKDAVVVGEGLMNGKPIIICAMDFRFIGEAWVPW